MFDPDQLNEQATKHGFAKRGARNWVRRTADFVQLVNLQGSQWSADVNYLNFALWALAFGEPTSLSESKFHFRTRADELGNDLATFFSIIDQDFGSIAQLRSADASGRAVGLMRFELRDLISEVEPKT
jgi:hypothetical protein